MFFSSHLTSQFPSLLICYLLFAICYLLSAISFEARGRGGENDGTLTALNSTGFIREEVRM
jgi:hypothetical protein